MNDSSMRILAQLTYATLAGLVFLAGCAWRSRSGLASW